MRKGIWVGTLIHIGLCASFIQVGLLHSDFARLTYLALAGLCAFPCLLLISRSRFMLKNAARVVYSLSVIMGFLALANISLLIQHGQLKSILYILLSLAAAIYLIGYRSYLRSLYQMANEQITSTTD